MAVRKVPEDFPDVRCAIGASAPGDRTEISFTATAFDAAVTVGDSTIDRAGSLSSNDVATGGRRVAAPVLPGPALFRATGIDRDDPVTGGGTTSGHLYGPVGDDVLVGGPGAADGMEGATGDGTQEVAGASAAGGLGNGNSIPLFFGGQAAEKPGEGWDAVRATLDSALPGHVEGQGLDGAWAAADHQLPVGEENLLLLDGTVAWNSGDGPGNRSVGSDLDDRPVGRAGSDIQTSGAGDDILRLLAITPFQATITDFWPGAGSNDRSAPSGGLFPSRERAVAVSR